MLVAAFFFFVFYVIFFSTGAFRLFLLFLGGCSSLAVLVMLFYSNTLSALFSYSAFLYKFEALNITYIFLLDGISLYFLLLTAVLFLLCTLIA